MTYRPSGRPALDETFRGITTDGRVRDGLFALADEGFAVDEAVAVARALLLTLEPSQRQRVCQPIDAPQWRARYNPEIPFNDYGVRLEATSPATRDAFRVTEGLHQRAGISQSVAPDGCQPFPW